MSGAKESIIIDASREKVFDVISDFESYPEFLPEMKDVYVEEATAKEVVASFTLSLIKSIEYTLKIKLNKPTSVSWVLVEGEMMIRNTGSWKLKKLSAKKTEATYTIDVGFGLLVPSSVANMLVERSLPQMLENFRERIEEG